MPLIAEHPKTHFSTIPIHSRMQAAVLYGQEDVRLETVPIPALAAGEMLVRVRTALTCGTDVKVYRRGYHAKMIQPPALFGHELAGDVVALGDGLVGFRPGDRVVAANSAPCDECFYCRRGQQNLCEDLLFNNGAYAEYIRLPERIVRKNTYRIPDALSYKDAALVEPLACALRGLDEANVRLGDSVVVLGLGPIGLMFVRLAKAVYGARVIAVARRREQIERALELGADEGALIDRSVDLLNDRALVRQIKAQTAGRGADVVFEAIGRPESWELSTQLVRKGGLINFFGGCPTGTKVGLDTGLLHYSEITCKASFHHTPFHIRRALQLLSDGYINAKHLVTHEQPLSELPHVLHEMAHRTNGQIKTAIIP